MSESGGAGQGFGGRQQPFSSLAAMAWAGNEGEAVMQSQRGEDDHANNPVTCRPGFYRLTLSGSSAITAPKADERFA